MERATKDKLTEAIKGHSAFVKDLEDRLEDAKKRKKEIEEQARERRKSISS